MDKPLSHCCKAPYKIEYWQNSLSRRCNICNKRCSIISADDIVEEEEQEVIPEPTAIEVTL